MKIDRQVKLEILEHNLKGPHQNPKGLEHVKGLLNDIPLHLVGFDWPDPSRSSCQAYVFENNTTGYETSFEIQVTSGRLIIDGLENLSAAGYSFKFVSDAKSYDRKSYPPSSLVISKNKEIYVGISNARR